MEPKEQILASDSKQPTSVSVQPDSKGVSSIGQIAASSGAKSLPIIIGAIAGVIVLIGGGVGVYFLTKPKEEATETEEDTGEPENLLSESEIIKKISFFKNANKSTQSMVAENESAQLGGGTGNEGPAANAGLGKGVLDTVVQGYYPEDYQNGLMHTDTTVTYGDGVNLCKPYYSYGVETDTYEYEDYWYNGDNKYASKWIEYLPGGVETTSLSADNYWLMYMGGEYAVKETYSNYGIDDPEKAYVETEAVDYEGEEYYDDYEPTLEEMYGPDATLEGPEQRGGKYYYVLRYTTDAMWYCDTGDNRAYDYMYEENYEPENIIIYKVWINAETGEWEITEQFYDEETDSNLISSSVTMTEFTAGGWGEFEDIFVFNTNVPIKEIEYDDYWTDPDYKQMILDTASPILLFNAPEGMEIDYYYHYEETVQEDDYYAYWSDRAFYPAGQLGDKMYEYNNSYYECEDCEDYPVSEYYTNFSNDDYSRSGGIDAYNKVLTPDDIAKYFIGYVEGTDYVVSPATVLVGSAEITGSRYTVTNTYSGDYVGEGGETSYTYEFVTFVYSNNTYMIYGYSNENSTIGPDLLNLYVLDKNDDEAVDEIVRLIEENTNRGYDEDEAVL